MRMDCDQPKSLRFFRPTAELRRLSLLRSVANGDASSQRAVSDRLGISVSVVNHYLSSFLASGWITRREKNRRDWEYRITAAGVEKAKEELLRYVRETFVLFSHAKHDTAMHLASILGEGGSDGVVVYGAGDVGELVLHALKELGVHVAAVVDDDRTKQGAHLLGYRIVDPAEMARLAFDAVLVASYRYRQGITQQLNASSVPRSKVICL